MLDEYPVAALSKLVSIHASDRFFSNVKFDEQKQLFRWAYKEWLSIPKEFRVKMVQMDGAGTVFDPYCMAPYLALKETFKKVLGVELSHEQITEPMGLKKREHIQQLLQELKAPSSEEAVNLLHEKFSKILDSIIAQWSTPTPSLDFALQFLKILQVPIALNTGYSRKTLDIILSRQGFVFPVTSCADEVRDGTRFAMIERNMQLMNLAPADLSKLIFFTDARADVLNVRKAKAQPWIIGICGYSTHVDITTIKEDEDNKLELLNQKREKAKDLLLDSGAHLVIHDLASLPLVMITVARALEKHLTPEQVKHLQLEQPIAYRKTDNFLSCRL